MIGNIRERVRAGELLAGGWLNLGSSLTAEMAGLAGFDWVLVDLEHGVGDYAALVHQLQGIGCTPAAPVVRIDWNEPWKFKRVLDLGVAGVMTPYVNTADEAARAARAMRYPPAGIRGVARLNRACGFGQGFGEYFRHANEQLLTIVQIETTEALKNVDVIAAVEGVDVLFIGPLDLSVSLGIPEQYDHPQFKAAMQRVAGACRAARKAAGILLAAPEQLDEVVAAGFTFVALGSDGGMVASGMKRAAAAFDAYKGKGART